MAQRTLPARSTTAATSGWAVRPSIAGDASLLALVDRLGTLLDRSDLSELAVEAGGTRLVLRKAAALAPVAVAAAPSPAGDARTAAGAGGPSDAGGRAPRPPPRAGRR